ncbi:hypothetical protein [Xanthomonas sp. 3075]|uniref:hypothetical protein n=1 Tax=Xanthomonas sp. 3075 TaxID=3035315 RepID=UPI001C84663A|nr:hypothetical protein [Xanthomonas sp. 3075]
MRIRWLLIIWTLLAIAALLIRFVALGPSEALGTAYALLSFVLVAGFGAVLNQRVRSAHRAADPATWEHVTTVPGLGSGYYNNFRELGWLNMPASTVPPAVQPLWRQARRFLLVAAAWFVTTPVVAIAVSAGGA